MSGPWGRLQAWVQEEIVRRLTAAGIYGRTINGSYVRGILPGNVVTYGAPTGEINIGDANAEGTAEAATRTDHQHSIPAPAAGYPIDVDATAEADGAATTPARADHRHHLGTHAATHQNGGADEISVAGLSGLLADAQTPLSHGADKHTNRTRSIYIPASRLEAIDGAAPTKTPLGTTPNAAAVWSFADAVISSLGAWIDLPSDYVAGSSITVYFDWLNDTDTNTAHACRWQFFWASLADGDLLTKAYQIGVGADIAVPAAVARTRARSSIGSGSTGLTAGQSLRLVVRRDGTYVGDTMTGAGLLAGARLEYTADE